MTAADTNVFAYAFDDLEPVKQAVAVALIDDWTARRVACELLWQVGGEFLNVLRKWEAKGRMTAADVEAHFRDIRSLFPTALPSGREFDRCFDLRARYSLSHWDGMLVAAALEAGVKTLYSEDMAHGANYDGVVVVNPFLGC